MTKEEKNKILADKNSSENATALGGVDKDTLGKVNSTFTNSSTQTQAQNKANNQLTKYDSIANKDSIVSNKTWNTINQSFKTPTAVTEADAYLKGALSKIQNGKTSYSDSVREMMDKITNRDKFSYDVDNDPLFQQALASAMNSGRSAMQDTIGQAAALTGGYGSSYATSAGNQAYNAFIEDAYDNLPQYYQMALDAYNAEGDELYRQLDMFNTADEKEYSRMLNAYDATGAYRDRLYNEAYQQFRDTKSDAFASANLQISEHGQLSNDALNLYNAYANEADKMYEREFQKWDAEVRNAMQYAQMLNSDYWNQKDYEQTDEHFYENLVHDSEENQLNRDLTTSENKLDREHDKTMQDDAQEHQSSENKLDREHQTTENQKDRDLTTSENKLDREHQSSENKLDREHQTSENQKDRDHQASENQKDRNHQASENQKDRNHQAAENEKNRAHDKAMQDDAQAHQSSENEKNREHDKNMQDDAQAHQSSENEKNRVAEKGTDPGWGEKISQDEYNAAKDSKQVKNFNSRVLTENEWKRRGKSGSYNGKDITTDTYEEYIEQCIESDYNKGKISEDQASYLMAYYGII